MSEAPARFQASADVVARDIDEGVMLVNVRTGFAWKLNQVGALVWWRLDGVSDVASIVAEVKRQYGLDTDLLRQDVDNLLRDLRAQGLIRQVHAQEPGGPG
jgi:hypothetical protein